MFAPVRYVRSCVASLIALFGIGIAPASAQLDTVYSNYGGGTFLTRINAAASTYAGLGATYFNAADASAMQSIIQTDLQQIYQRFSINFVTTTPGGTFDTINFFNTNAGGLFGSAPFDWRNQTAGQTSDQFPANYTNANIPGLLDATFTKDLNIARFANALGTSAAHELGHTFGLDHQDAYGTAAITNQANTGGIQNRHVMRTGSTGAATADRVTVSTLNVLETAKLEVTANLIANGFTCTPEQAAAHNTPATAQVVPSQALIYNGVRAAVVNNASISAAGEVDLYRFNFQSNYLVTICVENETPIPVPQVNSFLRLYDTDGVTVLRSNDDVRFGPTTFDQAGDPVYVTGSMILNFPVNVTGNYYVEVTGTGAANTGNYELFVMAQSVPEPTTIAFIALSGCGVGLVIWRRRTRQRRESEQLLRV
jgi:hypothetical protein